MTRSAYDTNELGLVRTRPQSARFYLATLRPSVQLLASLSTVPANFPGSALDVNAPASGAFTNVVAGETIWVGTEPGKNDLGMLRVRKAPSGSTLFTSEFGSGLVRWQANACIAVMGEFRPWSIHHKFDDATSAWQVDFDPYTSQLSRYGPMALIGPPFVGWIESGGQTTACYVGDRSYSLTAGASITSQTWRFPNGVTVSSALGSSQTPIQVTYNNTSPDGLYSSLTVTDGNGTSHITRRLNFVFNTSTAQPMQVYFDQISGGNRAGGYNTRVYVYGSATSQQFQDGAEVVIFEKASYGTKASNVGGNFPFRQNIVMRGWITNDSQKIDPFTGEMSFAIETIDGILKKTDAYDLFLENLTAASSWDTACGLTLDRAATALVKHRSTISLVTDVNLASGLAATNEVLFQALPKGNLWAQLQGNYDERGMLGIVAADLQSSIYAQLDAQVTGLSANLPTTMEIAKRDRRDTVMIDHESFETISEQRIYAVNGASPLAAISPAQVAGNFGGRQEVTRGITVDSQQTLITWTGNVRAMGNNPYKRVAIPLAGNNRLDSVPQSRVTMTLSPNEFTNNKRGLNWNNQVLFPTETQISYDARTGAVLTQIVAETVVNGRGGSTLDLPSVVIDPPPSPDPGGDPGDGGGGSGGGDHVVVAQSAAIGYTSNFTNASPHWVNKTGSISGTIHDLILDPYDPVNNAWVVTTSNVYRTTNLQSSSPTWTSKLTIAAAGTDGFWRVHATIVSSGLIFVMGKLSGANNAVVSHTHDNGENWTHVNVTAGLTNFARGVGFQVSQHNDQNVWVGGGDGVGTGKVFRSTDGGHVFSVFSTVMGGFYPPPDIHVPYADNTDDSIVYVGGGSDSGTEAYLYELASGANIATSQIHGYPDGSGGSGRKQSVMVTLGVATILHMACRSLDLRLAEGTHFFRSTDSGASWTLVASFAAAVYDIGAWPYNTDVLYALGNATDGYILHSSNGGVNWSDKSGDWATVFGSAPASGWQIVPVWLL